MAFVGSDQRRIVLYPYGQPRRARHREFCDELVVGLGGDVARMIDAPTVTLDRFVGYIGRIAVLREGEESIVVFTRTNPIALAVVNARRRIERALPRLRESAWLLFVDVDDDPFFVESARKLGTFELGGRFPVWVGPEATRWEIVSPNAERLEQAVVDAQAGRSSLHPAPHAASVRPPDPRAEPSEAPPPRGPSTAPPPTWDDRTPTHATRHGARRERADDASGSRSVRSAREPAAKSGRRRP